MSNDTVGATAPASPEADEYVRLLVDKVCAEQKFESLLKKRKAEADTRAEEPKQEASRAFAQAHYTWLAARAALSDPGTPDEEMTERMKNETEARRQLFATPAAYADQVWQKFDAFQIILADELVSGPTNDAILLMALGSIRQDGINLDLHV